MCSKCIEDILLKKPPSTDFNSYDKKNNEYKFTLDINNTENRFDVAI